MTASRDGRSNTLISLRVHSLLYQCPLICDFQISLNKAMEFVFLLPDSEFSHVTGLWASAMLGSRMQIKACLTFCDGMGGPGKHYPK